MPIDQTTLIGYVSEIVFCISFAGAYFIANGALLLLFVSICLHHAAFSKVVQHRIAKLSVRQKEQSDAELLRDLVRFHVSVKT